MNLYDPLVNSMLSAYSLDRICKKLHKTQSSKRERESLVQWKIVALATMWYVRSTDEHGMQQSSS